MCRFLKNQLPFIAIAFLCFLACFSTAEENHEVDLPKLPGLEELDGKVLSYDYVLNDVQESHFDNENNWSAYSSNEIVLYALQMSDAESREKYAAYEERDTVNIHLEQTAGDSIIAYSYCEYDSGSGYLQIYIEIPEPPARSHKATYSVSVQTAGQSVAFEAEISFIEVNQELHEIEIPAILELQMGTPLAVPMHFSDGNGWAWGPVQFLRYVCFEGERAFDIMLIHDELYITPCIAGAYMAELHFTIGNVNYHKQCSILISDEQGNIPTPDMDIAIDGPELRRYQKFYIAGFNAAEGEFYAIRELERFYIVNYLALKQIVGGGPEWELEQISGPDFLCHYEYNEDNGCIRLFLDSMPEEPGTAVLKERRCWGGETKEYTYVIDFCEASGFHGVDFSNVPDRIEMQAGDTREYDVSVLCDGWNSQDQLYLYTRQQSNAYVCTSDGEQHDDGTLTLCVQAIEPGVFRTKLVLSCAENLRAERWITLCVSDAEGTLPFPELKLNKRIVETDALLGEIPYTDFDESSPPICLSSQLASVSLENYAELSAVLDGEPTWTIEHVSGATVDIEFSGGTHEYEAGTLRQDLYLYDLPVQAGTSVYRIRCEWCEYSAAADLIIHFVKKALPEGLDLPMVIDMQVGQVTALPVRIVGDWHIDADTDMTFWLDNHFDYEEAMNARIEGNTVYMTPTISGNERAVFTMTIGNVTISQSVLLRIRDRDGNQPAPIPILSARGTGTGWDDRVIIAPLSAAEGQVYSIDELCAVEIENLPVMNAFAEGDPEWSIAYDGEHALDLSIRYDSETGKAAVLLNAMPEPSTGIGFTVRCTWGGQMSEYSFENIEFIKETLPKGVDLPATILMKPGDVRTLAPEWLYGRWSEEDYYGDWLEYRQAESPNTTSVALERDPDNDNLILTAIDDGVAVLDLMIQHGNLRAHKRVAVYVSSDESPDADLKVLSLPAFLQQIDDEAFMLTSVEKVVIPDGCTRIGKMAFAGCPDLIEIVIPESVASIADDAFANTDNVRIITSEGAEAYKYAQRLGLPCSLR